MNKPKQTFSKQWDWNDNLKSFNKENPRMDKFAVWFLTFKEDLIPKYLQTVAQNQKAKDTTKFVLRSQCCLDTKIRCIYLQQQQQKIQVSLTDEHRILNKTFQIEFKETVSTTWLS